ncbi:hypothetical protein RJ640_008511 [Escallonia rubra]|uniref:CP12 domain-containing protein n=1 Tax=Escallonia rubra TaxID=112253 RepID=A0AA88UGG3_9ASTE|nr:hypothetical protein RJ640_008511 [Escallonia rubra]
MASFTSLTVGSPRCITSASSFSSRSAPIRVPARQKRGLTVIRAMGGGAKYKGTQMREEKLAEMIEKKVKEARQVCEGDERSDECKVAWDEVEEVSQAKADLRIKLDRDQDPLTSFCEENPETDECRIYED